MTTRSFASLFGIRAPAALTRDALIQQYGSVNAALKYLTHAQKMAYMATLETPYNPMKRNPILQSEWGI